MADVRLTATNPEDSSVVPVACNAKGELKLEEPIVTSDLYVEKSGDTMTGSLSIGDNITFDAGDGSARFGDGGATIDSAGSFVGNICWFSNTIPEDENNPERTNVLGSNAGVFTVEKSKGSAPDNPFIKCSKVSGNNLTGRFMVTNRGDVYLGQSQDLLEDYKIKLQQSFGSADFAGGGFSINKEGRIAVNRTDGVDGNFAFIVFNSSGEQTIEFKPDGSAVFANKKAGFTKNGYLWCTTRRGDTVVLDATSNGMGIWEPYDPPTMREEILDAWSEKNVLRPKPEESSQDGTETTQ